MRGLTISDTHNKHKKIPKDWLSNEDGYYDMIIHSGDISSMGHEGEVMDFLDWYNELPFKYKILIAGNHDFFFETESSDKINNLLKTKYKKIIYLDDSSVVIEGIKIHGSPVQPWFHDWAFNRVGEEIKPHWDMIPDDTNILITHGPIQGCLDRTIGGAYVGCPYLKERINELKELKLVVHGHIHEAYGRSKYSDNLTVINASVLDRDYDIKNPPQEFEI